MADLVDVRKLMTVLTKLVNALQSEGTDKVLVVPDNPPNIDVKLSTRASEATLQNLYSKVEAITNALDSVGSDKVRVTIPDAVSVIIATGTRVVEYKNYVLQAGETNTLLDYTGRGRLHEITVISQASTFKITIYVDGQVIWDKQYSEAEEVTDEVVMMSAFQREDNKYVYHISNIPFNQSVKVDITNTDAVNNIVFDYVFLKYEG